MDPIVLLMNSEKEQQINKENIRRKHLRVNSNIFDLSESIFKASFRINKDAFKYILEEIQTEIKPSSIPVVSQLAATLILLTTGKYIHFYDLASNSSFLISCISSSDNIENKNEYIIVNTTKLRNNLTETVITTETETETNKNTKNTDKLLIVEFFKTNETEAEEILLNAENYMKSHYQKLRDMFKSSHQKFSQINNGPLLQETMSNLRDFQIDLATKLSPFRIDSFKNDTLKRRCKLLSKLQLEGLPKDKYDKVQTLLRVMKQFSTSKNVCNYDAKQCNERDYFAYIPKIKDIISLSKQHERINYYWREWRNIVGPDAKNYFIQYVDYFRQTAFLNGHITPSYTWYLYYETPNLLEDLENAIKQIEPLYKELHAYVRQNLIEKYPSARVKVNKPIPQHLMEQVLEHSWKASSAFKVPYPKLVLPNVLIKMSQQTYTSKTINDVSENFYKSLDIENLPNSFWDEYARMISDDEIHGECKAEILYYPPEIALKYCPKITYKYFLQMHGQMGELHYNYRRGKLPFGLDGEACPGFGKAIGEAAVISAGCPRYLNRIGLTGNETLTPELSKNRLFRMAIHTIFGIMQHFVNEKFWVNVLDGKIKLEEMNCEYWKIQEEFAGVSAPVERSNINFDVNYKFYEGINPNKATTKKLVSELVGYQIMRALCIESGHYVPGDSKYPLHNCDFSDSSKSGKYLEEVMRAGSTKSWRDILENLTGTREIDANAIWEYYYPIYVWIKEQNEQNEVETGWNDSYMCEDEV